MRSSVGLDELSRGGAPCRRPPSGCACGAAQQPPACLTLTFAAAACAPAHLLTCTPTPDSTLQVLQRFPSTWLVPLVLLAVLLGVSQWGVRRAASVDQLGLRASAACPYAL